ncbi:hypothetical protein PC41400_27120 [Paenibacillus chitinolyticus]|uniref:Uncharacterized protein n=1 Tax=Paenibacillus chitinolyticus TaxID=79263 RepID=A0A410X3E4_9BACL|nr:hypothetical protein [Paenibacillus chitinolyticus]MCY9592994.1 hypothetical protein [Paenibacillus chitinolyticus]MCY9598936.1 hypothetical protein [Paenibacillus chitinolyticus]QAV21148.1 hypothetical protein PC41400_27120 [Paenibacillus chitinolyticus]
MSMKERKLFFTRNGEYTVWEMLNALTDTYLEELYEFALTKRWTELYPKSNDEFPSFLFNIFEELDELNNNNFLTQIQDRFYMVPPPRSDFNAIVFHYYGTSLDLGSVEVKLDELKRNLVTFGIDGLQLEFFIYSEINGHKNVVDLRFTSEKSSYYKKNENIQFLNTEIRIYLNSKIALLTNFSQYTHSDKDKYNFINNIIRNVSSYSGTDLKPIHLSDQSLRELLLLEDTQIPSRLKFEVEGRLKVNIDINQKAALQDLIYQDEIKYFYDKFPLSTIKVNISDTEIKPMTVDGLEGKIMTRVSNVEVLDIDNFIKKLSILLEYDYLNQNYQKNIQDFADNRLTTTKSQKDIIVQTCYAEVERVIKKHYEDVTGVFVKVIQNAFFFCLKSKIKLVPTSVIKIEMDDKAVKYLAIITDFNPPEVINVLGALLELYSLHNTDIKSLMIEIDKSLNLNQRMIPNASGL